MLFITVAVVAVTVVLIVRKQRGPGGVNASPLGWMSQEWLAEYRASHRS